MARQKGFEPPPPSLGERRLGYWLKLAESAAFRKGIGTYCGHKNPVEPRDITERLAEMNYKFDEADAWLDLWCHTVFRDYGNAFSFLSPVIQYDKYGSMLTLETLGKRWGWEKTKVWRFFRKYPTYFHLYRLPNSYGCVIYNHFYPSCDKIKIPDKDTVMSIFRKILISAHNTHTEGTVNERGNR